MCPEPVAMCPEPVAMCPEPVEGHRSRFDQLSAHIRNTLWFCALSLSLCALSLSKGTARALRQAPS
jgi:hypothetical protein